MDKDARFVFEPPVSYQSKRRATMEVNKCLFCDNAIPLEARLCPHCGRHVEAEMSPFIKRIYSFIGLSIVLFGAFLVVLAQFVDFLHEKRVGICVLIIVGTIIVLIDLAIYLTLWRSEEDGKKD